MKYSIALAVGACALAMIAQQDANLVRNGNFAQVDAGRPAYWEAAGDPQRVTQTLTVVNDGGRACAKLTCSRIEGEGGAVHAMLAQVGVVRLNAGSLYEFSCRARQEGIQGRSVSVAISDTSVWANCGLERSLAVEPTWKQFRYTFRASRTVNRTSRLQFWFLETGTLYLTDVRIVESPAQAAEFTDVVPPPAGPNLVPNGSFALDGAGWSSTGIITGWGDLARLHGTVMRDRDPSHPHFLRIPMGAGRTPVLGFDYYVPVMRAQTRALAANRRWIRVEPGASYTLAADMRSSEDRTPAVLAYTSLDPGGSRWSTRRGDHAVTLSREWRRYTFTFQPPSRYVFIMVGPDLREDRRVDVDVDNIALTRGEGGTPYTAFAPLEVAVEPTATGGAFVAGRPAHVAVRASNSTSVPHKVVVRLSAADYFGKPMSMKPTTVSLPPNGCSVQTVTLPADWRGWYAIHADGRSDDGMPVAVLTPEVRVSIVPEPGTDSTVLGLNHAFPDPYLIPLARMAGISQYRDWSLKWEHIEPKPGEWHWEVADAQINRVIAAGAQVMALLPPFPSAEWSSTAPPELRTQGYPGERIRQAWAPSDPAQLADFARRAVERYRDRIGVWEFLNEPIYTDYSLPRSHYKPADYVRLLRPVAEAIRRGDPRARVMGGAGAGTAGVTQDMIEEGLLDTIDILNIHIYPGARAPEGYIAGMDQLLREMDRRGKRKPIWVTEFSYYAADNLPRKPFLPDGDDWAENRLLESESECAEFTVRFCAIMLARGCERIFIHSGSSGSVNMPSFECCLFDYGGTPRKVASALAVLAHMLGSNPTAIAANAGADGVHRSVFRTATGAVAVVWSPTARKPLRVPAGARASNLMGTPIKGPSLILSGAPVYIVGSPEAVLSATGSMSRAPMNRP
jgi:hypothetical protein